MNNTFIIPTFDTDKINEIRDFYNLNNNNEITNALSYNYGYMDGRNDCNDDSDNSFSSSSDYSSLGLGSNSANSSFNSNVSSLTDLDTTDYPDESFYIEGGKKRKRKRKNKRKSKKHKKKQRRRTKKGGMDFLTLDIEDINKENITYSKEMPTWLDKENLPKGVRILEGPEKRKVLEESKAINILMNGVYFKIYKDLLDTPEKLDEFIENMFIVIETKYSRDYIKQILNNANKSTDVIKGDPVFYKVYTREEPTGNFGIEDSGIVIERDDIAELKQKGNPFGSRKPKLKTRKRPSDITISSIKGKKAPGNDYRSITPQSITYLPTLGGKRKRKRITRKRKR
tara:strand:- start:1052 stop:2074 length:1023 start_codon:yes stop_codon:yes gene_type:complete